MGTWLGSGAVSQQKWWSCWVGGDEESWDLGESTLRRKVLCLSEGCDERQKVGEDPGRKEKELTREALTHCHESCYLRRESRRNSRPE